MCIVQVVHCKPKLSKNMFSVLCDVGIVIVVYKEASCLVDECARQCMQNPDSWVFVEVILLGLSNIVNFFFCWYAYFEHF